MKTTPLKKTKTLGDFITKTYDLYGERKAGGIVHLAFKMRLIGFQSPHRITHS